MKKLSIVFLILGLLFVGVGYYFIQSDLNSKVNNSKKESTENKNPKEDYGKKKLVCTQSRTESGISGLVTYTSTFDNETLSGMNVGYDFDYSAIPDSQFVSVSQLDFCAKLKEEQSSQNIFTNSTCNQRVENKHVILDIELDLDSLSISDKAEYLSIDTAKVALESAEYECKIEDIIE